MSNPLSNVDLSALASLNANPDSQFSVFGSVNGQPVEMADDSDQRSRNAQNFVQVADIRMQLTAECCIAPEDFKTDLQSPCFGTTANPGKKGCFLRQCPSPLPGKNWKAVKYSDFDDIFPPLASVEEFRNKPEKQKIPIQWLLQVYAQVSKTFNRLKSEQKRPEAEINQYINSILPSIEINTFMADYSDYETITIQETIDLTMLQRYNQIRQRTVERPICDFHANNRKTGREANEDPWVFHLIHAVGNVIDKCQSLAIKLDDVVMKGNVSELQRIDDVVASIQKIIEAAVSSSVLPYKALSMVLNNFLQDVKNSNGQPAVMTQLLQKLGDSIRPILTEYEHNEKVKIAGTKRVKRLRQNDMESE